MLNNGQDIKRFSWYSNHKSKADRCLEYYHIIIWDNHTHIIIFFRSFAFKQVEAYVFIEHHLFEVLFLDHLWITSSGCNSSMCGGPEVSGASAEFQHLHIYNWANMVSPINFILKQMQLVMDMFPGTKTYRVMEFLLTWNHSNLLTLLPPDFAFMCCCLLFSTSFNMAFSSICVPKILAPLPTELFCAAPASVQSRSQKTPGFVHCFPLFWTLSNYFTPEGGFLEFPTGLPVLLLWYY